MHHSSTCGIDVKMLLIVFMIHIIHVFRTIHRAHISKWEQIVLMGHMGHVGHVALLVHTSQIFPLHVFMPLQHFNNVFKVKY
jgi:hypothetical protein